MARTNYEVNRQKTRVPMPELDPVERAQTFDEVALGLSLIHISEPTRQAEISYAVFCLKKKKKKIRRTQSNAEESKNTV